MALDGREITVIGAGIGGLAAAVALSRRGARVTVLEQAPEIAEVGAGIQITPNGAAVIEALGLGPTLGAAALPNSAVHLRDGATARTVVRLDLTGAGLARGYFLIHRADLIALLEWAARGAGVTLRLGSRVERVEHGPSGCKLLLDGGEVLDTALAIAADGLHSRARRALNPSASPFFTGQVAWRTTIPDAAARHLPEAEVFMAPGRHLVSYPIRGGRARNLVAVEERRDWTDEGWTHRDDPDRLRDAFSGFGGPARDWLAAVETVHVWGLFRHPVAERWHDGRAVVLLGDAAHPTLPFLAQGANMALEDAWCLAALLDRHDDTAAALDAYQAVRQPRTRRIVAAANANARNYHLSGAARLAGHAMLRTAGAVAPGLVLRRFDWLYRHDVTQQVA